MILGLLTFSSLKKLHSQPSHCPSKHKVVNRWGWNCC